MELRNRRRSPRLPLALALLLTLALLLACGDAKSSKCRVDLTPTSATSSPMQQSLSRGCSSTMPPLTSGVYNVTVNGSERHYTVRVPTKYDPSRAYRVLLAFHWHEGTMEDVATKFFYYGVLLYQNESTILIAPQGLNKAWKNNGGEDVEFVKQILAAVESRLCVDPRQRFAMGFSYGASMSYSLACSMGEQIRAVAVLSGGEYSGCEGNGTAPVAFMGIHGIRDTVIPIEKGRAIRDTFVKANGCTPQTPPEPKQGELSHVRTAYDGCTSGHPVEWTAFDDAHTAMPLDGSLMQNSTATWMPQAVWTFFSQFK